MYSAIRANKRNTVIIMTVFVALIGALGYLIGYLAEDMTYAYVILVCGGLYAAIEYFAASSQIIRMSGAVPIKREDNPTLWNTVENLAMTDGLPMPKVYIIDDPAPNAFATGRDPEHASVAATTGLLDLMDKRELNGVMAHELSHVKNYDIRVSMIVFGLTCAIGYISDMLLRVSFYGSGRRSNDDDNNGGGLILGLVGAILAPIVAAFVQLAVSRQREYLADASGALLTRDPDGLASALAKLESNGRPMRRQNNEMAHLYINNPLKSGGISKLFSTHPPIEDRIKRLEDMRDRM